MSSNADLAALFAEDRDRVRIPLAERGRPALTSWPSSTKSFGPVAGPGTARSTRRSLASKTTISPVRARAMRLALLVGRRRLMRSKLHDAGLLGLELALADVCRAGDAADVEGTHRELRARLADRLGGDDADGHAFFDQCRRWPGPCRSTAGRRRAAPGRSSGCGPMILSMPSCSIMLGLVRRDHLVLVDDRLRPVVGWSDRSCG